VTETGDERRTAGARVRRKEGRFSFRGRPFAARHMGVVANEAPIDFNVHILQPTGSLEGLGALEVPNETAPVAKTACRTTGHCL